MWLRILLQMHLYTGLFITAHDAMHGSLAPGRRRLNDGMGWICSLLFAFNSYRSLRRKHHLHHRHVATSIDPDYHRGGFATWYFSFIKNYITWQQIALMALTYNLLMLLVPERNIALFWMIPSLLSTLQLFYFGTYLPHRGEHAPENRHQSGSQRKNHLWAFLSCYFFGYHYEHHDAPRVPWWRMWREKE
jgi:beta-carotene ketolase (CrtW type)